MGGSFMLLGTCLRMLATLPAAHQVLARLCRHLLFLIKKIPFHVNSRLACDGAGNSCCWGCVCACSPCCLRMLATLPAYEARLQPRTKFWLVFAAICFSLKKIFFHVILDWTAVGRKLYAVGDITAHARHAAVLRGAPPAAHQVLARLCCHLLFLKKSFLCQF
jgi:hypothetical protein